MSSMSGRAMHIACSRVEMSRDSALVMFFYMRLETHVCNAMSRSLLLHEYLECFLVRWRVRATYATDNDNLQTKERFMHATFEFVHCE